MKRTLFACAAALLLALPVACMHPGHHAGPGGPNCQKRQGCDCRCRQQPDCPKTENCPKKEDCPKQGENPKPVECPQHRQQEAPPPAK
jgi:hypothetical protein